MVSRGSTANVARWLLAVASAIALAGCNGKAQEATVVPTPVRIAESFIGPAAPTIRTNGLLVNKDEIRLSFKVGGVIRHLAVHEGEHVHGGQLLAEIEQTEVNAQVEQARQAYDKAQRDLARGERLHADQVISLEQLQDLRTQAAVSQAALKTAQFNSNYSSIVAPRDGTVLRRLAEERELVGAGTPVLVLGAQDRGFVVRAGLADREIVQVKLDDAAKIRLDALPDVTLSGKVTEIASAADPASGMFNIEVLLDATSQPLKSGLVAKVSIVPAAARASELVYVPVAAIVEGNGRKASVFVLDGDRARRREVDVAFIEDTGVALTSGIQAGEKIVTDGSLYLEDGEVVAVQPADNATAPTGAAPSLPSAAAQGRERPEHNEFRSSSLTRSLATQGRERPPHGNSRSSSLTPSSATRGRVGVGAIPARAGAAA